MFKLDIKVLDGLQNMKLGPTDAAPMMLNAAVRATPIATPTMPKAPTIK